MTFGSIHTLHAMSYGYTVAPYAYFVRCARAVIFSCDGMLTVSARIAAVSAVSHIVLGFCHYYSSGVFEASTDAVAMLDVAHQKARRGSEYSMALLPFSQSFSLGYRYLFHHESPLGGDLHWMSYMDAL